MHKVPGLQRQVVGDNLQTLRYTRFIKLLTYNEQFNFKVYNKLLLLLKWLESYYKL